MISIDDALTAISLNVGNREVTLIEAHEMECGILTVVTTDENTPDERLGTQRLKRVTVFKEGSDNYLTQLILDTEWTPPAGSED